MGKGTKKRKPTSEAIARAASRAFRGKVVDIGLYRDARKAVRTADAVAYVEEARAHPETHPVFAQHGDVLIGGLALFAGLLGVPMTFGRDEAKKLSIGETTEVGISLVGRYLARSAGRWLREHRDEGSEAVRQERIALECWESEGGSYR